jgi:phosphoesterase RecJ-like protein
VASKPCIVLDHHATEASISFATVLCIQPVVATGQLIYELAQQLSWPLNKDADNMIAASIMSDSLGLVSEGTSARTIHIIGELVEKGVSLAGLETLRRDLMRKSPELTRYKGELLQRVEYHDDDRIATVTIPWEEIQQYSPLYNPSMLVIDDMRMTEGTDIAIAFKVYKDGKITGKVRANYGISIADKLAENFGGGGHRYASGFKITDGRPINEVKSECIKVARQLLDNLK